MVLFLALRGKDSGEALPPNPSAPIPRRELDTPDPARVARSPVEAAPAASPPQRPVVASRLQGRVVNPAGAPVPGASVDHVAREGDVLAHTECDEEGRFTLESEPRAQARFVGRSQGFGPGTAPDLRGLAEGPSGPIVLTLTHEARIRGAVTLPSGSPPSVPVLVLAWRDAEPTRPRATLEKPIRDASHPLFRCVKTDRDGRFEFDGLEAGAQYQLSAGGEGYAQCMPEGQFLVRPVEAIAGGGPVKLLVAPLFALRVDLGDPDSGPLRSAPQLFSYPFPSINVPKEIFVTDKSLPGAWLNPGVDFHDPPTGNAHRFYMICTAEKEVDRIGPVTLTGSAPGYEPFKVEVWATRVPGGLEPKRVTLQRKTEAWGRLRIRVLTPVGLDGKPMWTSMVNAPLPFGRIKLRPVANTPLPPPPFEAAVPHQERPEIVLDGVPAGSYRVNLWTPLPGDGPETLVSIPVGGEAQVTLDSTDWGVVEASIDRKVGGLEREFTGQVLIELETNEARPISASTVFESPPYCVLGVPPGRYKVYAARERFVSERVEVEVRSGLVSKVKLRIDEDAAGR